jgi:hypothetical protein
VQVGRELEEGSVDIEEFEGEKGERRVSSDVNKNAKRR